MQSNGIPVKTEAGQREIGAREHKLPPRTRSLLIAINGSQPVAEIVARFHSLGDVAALLDELAGLGLIRDTTAIAPAPAPVPIEVAAAEEAVAPVATAIAAEAAPTPAFHAKQLMNESAVAALGLRAFLFTLKLEHCYTPDELRRLLPEYARVLGKARGEPFAQAMIGRVEAVLAGH